MTQQVGMIAVLAMLDTLATRVRDLEIEVDALQAYVWNAEPNILPDIKPEGRGLEEYTVGISGTDETI